MGWARLSACPPAIGADAFRRASGSATRPRGERLPFVGVAVVYLLRCADGTLYCGWTVDLDRRVAAHATGRASKYTAARRPVAVAAAWKLGSQSAARKAEWALKQLTRRQKEALIDGAPLDGAERFA
jgi:putative endonuclease